MSGAFESVRRWLRRVGLAMLGFAALGAVSVVTGALDSAWLAIGAQSGYRTLAEIAVIGCLLCAIGYWDE